MITFEMEFMKSTRAIRMYVIHQEKNQQYLICSSACIKKCEIEEKC